MLRHQLRLLVSLPKRADTCPPDHEEVSAEPVSDDEPYPEGHHCQLVAH